MNDASYLVALVDTVTFPVTGVLAASQARIDLVGFSVVVARLFSWTGRPPFATTCRCRGFWSSMQVISADASQP